MEKYVLLCTTWHYYHAALWKCTQQGRRSTRIRMLNLPSSRRQLHRLFLFAVIYSCICIFLSKVKSFSDSLSDWSFPSWCVAVPIWFGEYQPWTEKRLERSLHQFCSVCVVLLCMMSLLEFFCLSFLLVFS